MKNKTLRMNFIVILIIAILNFMSCSSLEVISKKEVDEGKVQIDFNKEIYITTTGNTRYHFLAGNFNISNDSLYGKGAIESFNFIAPFKGALAVNDIISFEQTQPDKGATIGLLFGIVAVGLLIAGLVMLFQGFSILN